MRLILVLEFFALAFFAGVSARAEEAPLKLKQDADLRGSLVAGQDGPLFLSADQVESVSPSVIEASGNVEARKAGRNFFADYLRYDHDLESIDARGKVRLEQSNLILTGDTLKLQLENETGLLTKPVYRILPVATTNIGKPPIVGRGQAETLELLDRDTFTAKQATYTTCPVGNEDWQLQVADLDIDQGKQIGTARNVLLRFKDVPLLYTPWADFSLNDARKSGFLPPTIGFTGKSGLDVTLPYYFNLAPNYDATVYPRFLATRGLQLGGEFRYLTEQYQGDLSLEYLHKDQTEDRSRWLAALNHTQQFSPRLKGQVLFQRVSDDEYFRDLSNQVEITSRSILPQEARLSYDGDWWQAGLLAQALQTLQDPAAPIAEPYNRLPQISLTASRNLFGRLVAGLDTDYTYFRHHNPDPATQVDGGGRFTAYPSLKLPYSNSAFFITPKVGYHYTRYSIDQPLPGDPDSVDRGLPIASLDTGLIFERDFSFRGNSYLQTLEPRAYYVYAPFREQSNIPIFDTAPLDLSFAQIFNENQFIGGDRINDANQLTLAMSSRFIDESSGLERLKVAFGQRYYFASQKVTLPGTLPRDSQSTDLLALVSGQINSAWRVDAGWQFDTDLGRTIKNTLSASYRPEPGRAVSMGYRFLDGSVEQLDTSFQWPLSKQLYGLFRANYSLRDNNLVEGLAGLEYNGGCWMLRGAIQRIATAEKDASNSFFLQLELNGMGKIGANPLSALNKSIPGYTPTNEFQAP